MDFNSHLQASDRLLTGLESGNLPLSECFTLADQIDSLLVYFTFRFLREKYGAGHPSAQGVASRLLEFSNLYPEIVKKAQEGEKDPLKEWFEDSFSFQEFYPEPEKMMTLLLEKIES